MAQEIKFTLYKEQEDFQYIGAPEPFSRSQNLILNRHGLTWHVKFTFNSDVLRTVSDADCVFTRKIVEHMPKRRDELRSFILTIDFSNLELLPDTVTEVQFSLELHRQGPESTINPSAAIAIDQQNRYLDPSCHFSRTVHEDRSRIIFPPIDESLSTVPEISHLDLLEQKDITGSATLVKTVNDERLFIYKRIDRPLYQSMDTQVLVVEARNLQRLSFSAHIVKLVAIAVSANPYRTDSVKEGQPVIRGIILEYHTGGTLEQWLDDDEKGNKS
ncbi:hypothetical protein B0A52_07723 [Exophiala mesophila]|uniref:Protein kinase domain-containing protein n=1 Tax=Exophiala mesophila TaxID=212818 RepID=A0A438MXX0_EXOME|nr:hypothetical protein B0A52_07723 [Exophiala mesophila]